MPTTSETLNIYKHPHRHGAAGEEVGEPRRTVHGW